MALDGVSRDQGPLAGVKPPHSASEAHALDRLDPVLFRRFADDENALKPWRRPLAQDVLDAGDSAVPNILEVLEQPDVPGLHRAVRPLVRVVLRVTVRQAHEDDRSAIEAAPQQPVVGNISWRRAALPR